MTPQKPRPQVPVKTPTQPADSETELRPHEVEMARKRELLARVRVTRESMLRTFAEVQGKKPDRDYIWVNVNEHRRTTFEGMGYTVCKDPDIKSQWKREDGTHVRGDLILYHVPKELREAWHTEGQLRAIEDQEGAPAVFEDYAARAGVPTYRPPSGA